MSKFLLLTVCAFGLLSSSALAQAQCSYRMNDVGRPHGYLSGPCNGAAQGYSGAYPSRRATWYRRDGSVSPTDPSLRTVRTGNTARVYNGSGQLTQTVIKNGNTARGYDARGRLVRRAVFGPNGTGIYDTRGRFLSSTPDIVR
jgi:YD repeat-containing protein